MIQRIQTIWLLLAGVCTGLTIVLPFYSGIQDPTVAYQVLNGKTGGLLIMFVTLLVAVLCLVNIALFKNRKTQLRLCIAALITELLLVFLYYKQTLEFTQGNYALTAILHLFVLLFIALAARGIYADEKLIKESDRLR
jgi:hypothetical protein